MAAACCGCPVLSECWHSAKILCSIAAMMCTLAREDRRRRKRQKQVAPLPQREPPPEATADDRAMEGAACERADDVRGAISAYSRALARDPRHLLSLFRLGSLYGHHGKPELAVVYLRRARAASPDHAATARLLEELENTVDVDELEIPLLQEGDAPPFLEDGPLLDETTRLAARQN